MQFYKYQGTGNDFILIDNRSQAITLSTEQIRFLCDRKFGIGADGLMLLSNEDGYDFKMTYYNSDGNESSMCGNGGRCIVAFAKQLSIINDTAFFVAIDGQHIAEIIEGGIVKLKMNDVDTISIADGHTILNTGSPHYIKWVKNTEEVDVYNEGREIRNAYSAAGINVNFVEQSEKGLKVRTYERGVENETLSCGTGVTASAIAATCSSVGAFQYAIDTPGGTLQVAFTKYSATSAKDIYLIGPATFVFKGEINAF